MTDDDANKIAAELMASIEARTAPDKMSKDDAMTVLQALASELDEGIETLQSELEMDVEHEDSD